MLPVKLRWMEGEINELRVQRLSLSLLRFHRSELFSVLLIYEKEKSHLFFADLGLFRGRFGLRLYTHSQLLLGLSDAT